MPEIGTYACSNNECRFTMRLSRNFPIWHADTPPELRRLPIHPSACTYIVGYRSDALCRFCGTIVNASGTCSACMSEGLYEEELGHLCPRCSTGEISLIRISVLS